MSFRLIAAVAAFFGITLVLVLGPGCAEKQKRIWIEPPIGYEAGDRSTRNLYYQVEDVQSGKREVVTIPVDQMPSDLVVEQHKAGGKPGEEGATSEATQADKIISTGKLPDAPAKAPEVTVSYLRSIQEVEDLYGKNRYNEALIKIAPLVVQYPAEPRLFVMQGTLYRKIGEKKLAFQAYKRAHELDGRDPQIEEAYLRLQDEGAEEHP